MANGTKDKPVKVTFDLPASLHEWLRRKAEAEERTVSAELRLLIRRHLGQEQEAPLKAA
jgi:hypothetical protein